MKNYIKNLAVAAVILGSLTSCAAYTDGYTNNDQNSYYNPSFNNGYYYAPASYYGNGGYYANDGYYYRDNMNYQYDNNVPYYYGQNKRKIYLQRQSVSQSRENGLQVPQQVRARNNSLNQTAQSNENRSSNSNSGFRNPVSQTVQTRTEIPIRTQPTPNRNQNTNEVQRVTETRSGVNNSGGFRNTETPQNSNRSENTNNGRR